MSDLVPGLPDGWLYALLVIAAAGPFVALAGHGTIAWVAIRRFFVRVSRRINEVVTKADDLAVEIAAVKASIPHVPTLEEIVSAVAAKLPEVPSLEEISNEVSARIPPIPPYPEVPDYTDRLNLLEERIGARLTVAMDTKWAALQEQLSTRVGQVVQANIASAKAAFSAANRDLENSMDPENDGSMLTEVLGIFMDEDSIKKVSRAKRLFKQFQAQGGLSGKAFGGGGGAAPQGGYAYGTILNGWVATPQGWQRIAAAAPPPAVPLAPPVPIPVKELPPELPPA